MEVALVDDLRAGELSAVDDPRDGLAGVVRPLSDELRVAAVGAVFHDFRD